MNEFLLKKRVRSLIFDVLREQADKDAKDSAPPKEPKPKARKKKKEQPGSINIATGAVGSGRFKKFVEEANARAKKDPRGLMKDLGVTTAPTGKDLDQVKRILDLATLTHPIMRQSYGGVKKISSTSADGEKIEIIGIYLSGLDRRNGIKFLSHTLKGAKNARFLNLQGALELGQGDEAPIVIYSI